jgi:UDP-glucose 4-epimerase
MRYLITGGSGYIGTRLVESVAARDETSRVVIADVRPPRAFRPKTEWAELDVRDAGAVRELIGRERPDVLVHLAFVLNPIKDEQLMYDIDVNGTHNVLSAASEAGTERVLVTSSTTAYGAFPDNPVPITEDWPVRGVAAFEYARDKTESDRLCQLWALEHPERTMTIVRPCIVFGPNVDNYLVRIWADSPFQVDLGGNLDQLIQFVHEDDVVDAIVGLMDGGHAGAFNVTGDGLMTMRETYDVIGAKIRKMPLRLAKAIGRTTWRLGASETPPGQLEFAMNPWVCSNEKVKDTLGWTPRYTSRETFEITMRARGVLQDAAEPSGVVPEVGAPAA